MFQIFLLFLSSSSGIPVTYTVPIVALWFSDTLCCFLQSFFFSLLVSFEGFYWDILKLSESFLSCVKSTNKASEDILHFCVFKLLALLVLS